VATFYRAAGYARRVGSDDQILLVELGSELVGAVRLAVENGETVLRGMRIAPEHQRAKIGTRLLEAAAATLGDRSCHLIGYDHLVGFYGQIGFREIEPSTAPPFLAARLEEYRRTRPQRFTLMFRDAGELLPLFRARSGHFLLESGHHGELWLDLASLFLRPERVAPFARALAERIAPHGVEVVCGPLVEGAFLALAVAAELRVPFTYSERLANADPAGLYPGGYRLPPALRPEVHGRRVAIVNDAINAGSAVRGTHHDLQSCGARPVVVASLLALGDWAHQFAAEQSLALEAITSRPNRIWPPADCPLCQDKVPVSQVD
jgi:orotate phosphoribosyltransferase